MILNNLRFDFDGHFENQISNQIPIFQYDFINHQIVPKGFKIRFCKIVNQIVEYPAATAGSAKNLKETAREKTKKYAEKEERKERKKERSRISVIFRLHLCSEMGNRESVYICTFSPHVLLLQ
jgi:hypothetical protein